MTPRSRQRLSSGVKRNVPGGIMCVINLPPLDRTLANSAPASRLGRTSDSGSLSVPTNRVEKLFPLPLFCARPAALALSLRPVSADPSARPRRELPLCACWQANSSGEMDTGESDLIPPRCLASVQVPRLGSPVPVSVGRRPPLPPPLPSPHVAVLCCCTLR